MNNVSATSQQNTTSFSSINRRHASLRGAAKRKAWITLVKEMHRDGWPVAALAEMCEASKPTIRRWLQRDEGLDDTETSSLTPINSRTDLTREMLHDVLVYNQDTGEFIWGSGRPRTGKLAGWTDFHGYRKISISGHEYLAHHLAWLYVFGVLPRHEIDHINGDRSDNRITNLRDVHRKINTQNQRRRRKDWSPELPLGTSFDKARNKFAAYIGHNGKTIALGRFDTPEEAGAAYLAAKRVLHDGCTI